MNTISKRTFSSIYKYASGTGPRVFLSVANGETHVGDLVFELYADQQPEQADNFITIANGETGASYVGTGFHGGVAGHGVQAGRIDEDNLGAYGGRNQDGDLSLRHVKRGQLSMNSAGPNQNGSEFTILFDQASYLDGYQTVFGELVEGESVLAKIEENVSRQGEVAGDFKIVASGSK